MFAQTQSAKYPPGTIGIFGFAVLPILRAVSWFSCKKPRFFGFGVHCSLRIFRFFNVWCPVFVKNTNVSSDLVPVSDVVFGFPFWALGLSSS